MFTESKNRGLDDVLMLVCDGLKGLPDAVEGVYMALMSLDPTGKGRKRWTMRRKAPRNAFRSAFMGS
ncbi:transposase [Streptomyces olivochromogenes]|uniref:transposase n=1 Tax=Streptomyces olivochromogenes TaxID=1963 RepID=UPI0036B67C9D